jgi:hypothetical protein
MTLVFAHPGDPTNVGGYTAERSQLVALRCASCKATKPLEDFPASCATYRRGSCRACNYRKCKEKSGNALLRKLESARVRYGTTGGMRDTDVALVYVREGLDWTDEANLKRTCLVRECDDKPFGRDNVTVRWRRPTDAFLFGSLHAYVVKCH